VIQDDHEDISKIIKRQTGEVKHEREEKEYLILTVINYRKDEEE
jgi:hypothetical protein